MKKTIKLLFSSFALLSLISCVNTPSTSSSNNSGDSSSIPISYSSKEESNSSESSVSSSSSSNSSDSSNSSQSSSSSTEVYYTVTFLNYDDSVLGTDTVKEGEEAHYSGETPTKEEDEDFTYEFIGWDQDLKSITSDVTTRATFKDVSKYPWSEIEWAD